MTQTPGAKTSANTSTRPTDAALSRVRARHRAAVIVATTIVALIIWAIGVAGIGLDLTVGSGPTSQTIGPAAVALVPLLAGAAAWGLLVLLERHARRGRRIWQSVAWAVLAVSLLGPLAMGAVGNVLATLLIMHLAVGLTLIVGLGGHGRRPIRVH